VIGDANQKNELTITCNGMCGEGKADCPAVVFMKGNETIQELKKGSSQVPVYWEKTREESEDFADFIKYYLIPNTDSLPQKYKINATSCAGTKRAMVQVFPQCSWNGKIGIKYFYAAHQDSNFNRQQGFKQLKVHGQWEVYGDISVKNGTEEWSLGASSHRAGSHQTENPITKQLFKGAQGFLDKITPLLGDIKSNMGKAEIQWPQLELEGAIHNIEQPDQYGVGCSGSVALNFNPLFGASVTVDVLEAILSTLNKKHPLATVLYNAKQAAAEGYKGSVFGGKASVRIDCSLQGDIKGGITFSSKDGKNWESKGEIGAGIDVKVKGIAEGNAYFFDANIAASASIGAESGISGKLFGNSKDGSPLIDGQMEFKGLTVYYSSFYEITIKETKRHTRSTIPTNRRLNVEHKHESKQKFVWLQPAKWPEQSSGVSLNKGGV
jgi:hypothetical protein